MQTALSIQPDTPSSQYLAHLAVLSLPSPHSRRAYTRQLSIFLQSGRPLNREGVQSHIAWMRDSGSGSTSINHTVSAIRLLAREAHARDQLSDRDLYSIETVRGASRRGSRLGNWISLDELRRLLDAAGEGDMGTRNQAILAVMAGCGLRRSEVCSLTWDMWQQREGRWVWVDVQGKGNKMRSVPCPAWAAEYVNAWRKKNDKTN